MKHCSSVSKLQFSWALSSLSETSRGPILAEDYPGELVFFLFWVLWSVPPPPHTFGQEGVCWRTCICILPLGYFFSLHPIVLRYILKERRLSLWKDNPLFWKPEIVKTKKMIGINYLLVCTGGGNVVLYVQRASELIAQDKYLDNFLC